ncbi:MAG: hypothetical protein HY581_02600 [Nitrospirae bacterium]|nr:hypothetical protein [Nitrospirota bacterium]
MKKIMLVLFVLLVSGSFTAAIATAQIPAQKGAPHAPVKIVQGTLKGVDPLNKTITVEIVEGQTVTLKVDVDAFEQIHRVGKKGERLELRLSAKDIVETVAVGTGP